MEPRPTRQADRPAATCSTLTGPPVVQIRGARGTVLRAWRGGIVVCRCAASPADTRGACPVWPYEALTGMRLDAYGPLGVVRATLGPGGVDLPLLLIEPDQVASSRRALDLVVNLMVVHQEARHSA